MKKEETLKEFKNIVAKRNFYVLNDSAKIFLYALIVPLLIGFLFGYVAISISGAFGFSVAANQSVLTELCNQFLWFGVLFSLVSQFCFIGIFFIYNKFNRIQIKACGINFKKTNWRTCVISALIGIVFIFGFIGLINFCFGALFKQIGISTESVFNIPLDTVGWYFICILVMCVIPAICEELIFRGMIFKGLRNHYSSIASILLTGLLFALIHQNIVQFIYPFIMGCVLALVMERTNNLIYPILIHFFSNLTTVTLEFLSNIGVINLNFNITWYFVVICVILAGVTGVLIWLIDKFYFQKHEKVEIENEGEMPTTRTFMWGKFPAFLILGTILSVVLIVMNIVL